MAGERSNLRFIGGGAPLKVSRSEETSDRVTLVVQGELDRETTPRLADAVKKAIDDAIPHIELDMAGVTFMDSQGLRILLEAKRATAELGDLSLTGVGGQVQRLLHATGLEDILGVDG